MDRDEYKQFYKKPLKQEFHKQDNQNKDSSYHISSERALQSTPYLDVGAIVTDCTREPDLFKRLDRLKALLNKVPRASIPFINIQINKVQKKLEDYNPFA